MKPPFFRFDAEGNNYFTEEQLKVRTRDYYDDMFYDDVTIEIFPSFINLPGNEKGLTLQEWINEEKKSYLVGNQKEIKVGEYKGIEIEDFGIVTFRTIFLTRNSKIYKFSIIENNSAMPIFNQILSTFKFID